MNRWQDGGAARCHHWQGMGVTGGRKQGEPSPRNGTKSHKKKKKIEITVLSPYVNLLPLRNQLMDFYEILQECFILHQTEVT